MSNDHGEDKHTHKKSRLPLLVSGTLIAGLVLSYLFVQPVNEFIHEAYSVLTSENEQRISDWVDQLGIWGPLLIVGAMVAQIFLIVVPSPLLMIISVLAYGLLLGALLAIVAILVAGNRRLLDWSASGAGHRVQACRERYRRQAQALRRSIRPLGDLCCPPLTNPL